MFFQFEILMNGIKNLMFYIINCGIYLSVSFTCRSSSRDSPDKSKVSSRDHSRTRSNSSSRRNSVNLGSGRPIQVIEEDQNGDAEGQDDDDLDITDKGFFQFLTQLMKIN
jgi:hypothetical protein